MPRAHTETERRRIRERLLTAGREGFIRLGLAKLTISDIAAAAGIGKGSFYGFFDSKEELFLAIQECEEEAFKQALLETGEAAANGRSAVTALLLAAATRLKEHPFLRLLLDPHTLSALSLRVPPERLEAHRRADQQFFHDLVVGWKARGWLRDDVDPQHVFDVLSAMFALSLQRELIGEDTIHRASAAIAEALAAHWC